MKQGIFPIVASSLVLVCGLVVVQPQMAVARQESSRTDQPLPKALVVEKLPSGALEIADAASSAKVGEQIVLRGRIAMAKDAFASGTQVFTLSDDAAVAACCPTEGKLMDECTIPASSQAKVQIADQRGQSLRGSALGKGGLKHGAEVFVIGKVVSAGESGLVVNATGIHVPRGGLPAGFFAREAPEEAQDLSKVKKAGGLKKGDKVALRGVIGGSADPFVAERAMFTLMGSDLLPCNANPDDKCARPWDYCCETKADIAANAATVRVVDARGNPLRTDFKGRAGIKELSEVVVVGEVAVAEKGVLIVDAQQMHIVKP